MIDGADFPNPNEQIAAGQTAEIQRQITEYVGESIHDPRFMALADYVDRLAAEDKVNEFSVEPPKTPSEQRSERRAELALALIEENIRQKGNTIPGYAPASSDISTLTVNLAKAHNQAQKVELQGGDNYLQSQGGESARNFIARLKKQKVSLASLIKGSPVAPIKGR